MTALSIYVYIYTYRPHFAERTEMSLNMCILQKFVVCVLNLVVDMGT